MKTRLALSVAILAAFVTTGLNLLVVANKITNLHARFQEQLALRATAETSLATANHNLERTQGALRETTAKLEITEDANRVLLARLEEQDTRVVKLTAKAKLLEQELSNTKANLAAYESVMTIQQVLAASGRIKSLQHDLIAVKEENSDLKEVVAQQEAELHSRRGNIVFLPAAASGTVLASDPKWHFVILSAGKEQGVLEQGELLVSRQGKLVGRVVVQRVDKDSSIANVMPGWQLAEILEGDAFIPAHPRS